MIRWQIGNQCNETSVDVTWSRAQGHPQTELLRVALAAMERVHWHFSILVLYVPGYSYTGLFETTCKIKQAAL